MRRIKAYNTAMRNNPARRERNDRSKPMPVKYWSFAGLMLTDWCNAACASCYLRCSPRRNKWMEVEQAVDIWRQLEALSPHGCRVHLTGGEPFGDWEKLLAVARSGHAENLVLDKIETNAFWATDEKIVRDRLSALDEAGMRIFSVSADPFHQQFVPIDRPRLARRVAAEVLGPGRVQVRWEDWLQSGRSLIDASADERRRCFTEWISRGRDRLNGRAAKMLAGQLPLTMKSPEAFASLDCREVLLRGRHVHIGPEGYIMPGVCAGIVLGRADLEPVADIWQRLCDDSQARPILAALVRGGPVELMESAKNEGFIPAPSYASKCHLCWSVRLFLHRKQGSFAGELGPDWLYSDENFR